MCSLQSIISTWSKLGITYGNTSIISKKFYNYQKVITPYASGYYLEGSYI